MTTKPGTHFIALSGHKRYGATLPSNPVEGQEFFDNINNLHYIYAGSQWWAAEYSTTTSTSTTTTSSSTSSSTTTSTSSSTTTTSSSTSTTTTV